MEVYRVNFQFNSNRLCTNYNTAWMPYSHIWDGCQSSGKEQFTVCLFFNSFFSKCITSNACPKAVRRIAEQEALLEILTEWRFTLPLFTSITSCIGWEIWKAELGTFEEQEEASMFERVSEEARGWGLWCLIQQHIITPMELRVGL